MNQIDPNITVEMVQVFQIRENYDQSFPCSHSCKITLTNGREIKKSIDGPEIYILIQSLAKEKIVFKRSKKKSSFRTQTLEHFNNYKDFPYTAFRSDKSKAPLPNELLSSLFDTNKLN